MKNHSTYWVLHRSQCSSWSFPPLRIYSCHCSLKQVMHILCMHFWYLMRELSDSFAQWSHFSFSWWDRKTGGLGCIFTVSGAKGDKLFWGYFGAHGCVSMLSLHISIVFLYSDNVSLGSIDIYIYIYITIYTKILSLYMRIRIPIYIGTSGAIYRFRFRFSLSFAFILSPN